MLFKIKGIEFVLFICRVYFESKKKKESVRNYTI